MDVIRPRRFFNALETFRIELPSGASPIPEQDLESFIQPRGHYTEEIQRRRPGAPCSPEFARRSFGTFCGTARRASEALTRLRNSPERYRVLPGAINPTFPDQEYKFGSFAIPIRPFASRALQPYKGQYRDRAPACTAGYLHVFATDRITRTDNGEQQAAQAMVHRVLRESHAELSPTQRLLIEYKHSYLPSPYYMPTGACRFSIARAGPQAKVLVDTGHNYAAQEYEQIVAWLLSKTCSAISLQRSPLRATTI